MVISLIVCLIILSATLGIISKHRAYCIEARKELENDLFEQRKKIAKLEDLEDELEKYKNLHKIYSDYFYGRNNK